MKWSLNDIPVFLAVVELGGITPAAARLNMPKSTVSQAIQRLEADLGIRLFQRNSRAIRVTQEGQSFYDKALPILEQAKEADAVISGLTDIPSGRLSVAAPPAFVQEFLAPRVAAFRQKFPEIDLEIVSTVNPVDFYSDGIDIAVVVGTQEDSSLITKRLFTGRLIWIASPAYARNIGEVTQAQDIHPHIQVCESRYATRRFPVHLSGRTTTLDLHTGILRLSDPLAVRTAIAEGAGVAPLPDRYCHKLIASGSLCEVFRNARCDHAAATLSVIYPGRRLVSPRIRAFLGFLDDIKSAHPERRINPEDTRTFDETRLRQP